MTHFWRRLLDRLRGKAASAPPEPAPPEPGSMGHMHEPVQLQAVTPTQVARAGAGPEPGTSGVERLEGLADRLRRGLPASEAAPFCDEVGHAIAAAVARGQERAAAARLQSMLEQAPGLHRLRARLAALYLDLGEEAWARPHLERLCLEAPRHLRAQAHFDLGALEMRQVGGEAAERRALHHYETVLALDFSYPRAADRARVLRQALEPSIGSELPTQVGAADLASQPRYRVREQLGKGGGGTVYRALDHKLGREVALKVLHPAVSDQNKTRERLFCEARITSTLCHPGIVALYDIDEGLGLLVMELCAGGGLHRVLPLPPAQAFRCLASVASTLRLVHGQGIVHGDLKPQNLLLREAHGPQLPVLTDFGIAGAISPGSEASQPMGSLVYMAPEQRQPGLPDPRMDLYSLGILLFEVLLGRPPLEPAQALTGVPLIELEAPWREMTERLPAVQRSEAVRLARELLAIDPDLRPPDAGEVSRRLRALAAQAPVHGDD